MALKVSYSLSEHIIVDNVIPVYSRWIITALGSTTASDFETTNTL